MTSPLSALCGNVLPVALPPPPRTLAPTRSQHWCVHAPVCICVRACRRLLPLLPPIPPLSAPAATTVYPASFSKSEPLTKPHTVTVLVALVVFVGYAGLSHVSKLAEHRTDKLASLADRFTSIKTWACAAGRRPRAPPSFTCLCVYVCAQGHPGVCAGGPAVLHGTPARHAPHPVRPSSSSSSLPRLPACVTLCVSLWRCAGRPHPALWRAVNGLGMFYFMFMAFLLFQVRSALLCV